MDTDRVVMLSLWQLVNLRRIFMDTSTDVMYRFGQFVILWCTFMDTGEICDEQYLTASDFVMYFYGHR
jgi:hypothetical protein